MPLNPNTPIIMKKHLFLALLATILLLSKLQVNGRTGNNQGMHCNPIIIFTKLNINDACGLQGETIEMHLEITDIFFSEIAFAISYNPEVISPLPWINYYEYGNCGSSFDFSFPEPGIIDIYISTYGFSCGGMALIYFSADTIGYSNLEFVESIVNPCSLWWAKPNEGSITVSTQNTQIVHLNQGWNGISSFLEPDQLSVDLLFCPLGNDLEFLCCDDWQYYPGLSGGMVPVWNMHQGYFIKISDETNFILNGNLPQSNEIQLDEGWNLIPVTSCHSIFPANFFGENINQVEVIKEAASGKVYWPEKDVYRFEYLLPGKSYLVKMTAPCTISPPQ
jgi:hypothetical protein